MPAPAHARSTVHVHGAEVSTDQSQLWDYGESLAVLVVAFALIAAAWIAMAPREDADLAVPAPPSATTEDFIRAETSTTDVQSPDVDAAESTAVTSIEPLPIGFGTAGS